MRLFVVGFVCYICVTLAALADITVSLPVGESLIANQLDHGSNTADILFPNPGGSRDGDGLGFYQCTGTVISYFDSSSPSGFVSSDGVTPVAPGILAPGQGAVYLNNGPAAKSVTFTGTPHVPVLPVQLACGFGQNNLLSRQTNDVGTYQNITGYNPQEGSQESVWNGAGLNTYTFSLGAWNPSVPPPLDVGQSAFFVVPAPTNGGLVLNCAGDQVVLCAGGGSNVCGAAWAFNAPMVSGGCCGTNAVILVLNTVTNGTGCGQSFTRTWKVTDCCSNSATCSQTIYTVPGPLVPTPPANTTVAQGEDATFSVVAMGNGPLSYQWSGPSGFIPGATGPSFTVRNAQPQDSGTYNVQIADVSSSTQTNVSAQLVVGAPLPSYTVDIPAGGMSLIANQLDHGSNRVADVLSGVPDGSVLYKYDNAGAQWQSAHYSASQGVWIPSTLTLNPGEGAFLQSPSSFTLTLRGTPHVPVLPVTIPNGAVYLLSRQTPDIGDWMSIVGTAPTNGAQMFVWNGTGYDASSFHNGIWSPSEPQIPVGASVWVSPSGGGSIPSTPGPLVTPIPDQVLQVGDCAQKIYFTAALASPTASSLSFSATSSNSNLVAAADVVFGGGSFGGGGSGGTWLTAPPKPGLAGSTLITVTVDNGSQTSSTSFHLTVLSPTTSSSGTSFEPAQGYGLGDLNAQDGWSVDYGTAVIQSSVTHTGGQAVQLSPGSSVSRAFSSGAAIVTWSAYMQAVPSAAPTIPQTSSAAVLYLDPAHGITCLDGDGNGGGSWVGTGLTVTPGAWFKLGLALNFSTKTWQCSVNGNLAPETFHFQGSNVCSFSYLAIGSPTNSPVFADDVTFSNTFVLPTPPSLTITLLSSNAVAISWPATTTTYLLQATPKLINPDWVTLPASNNLYFESSLLGTRFYRLIGQ